MAANKQISKPKNALLKLLPDIQIKDDVYIYNNHTQWDEMMGVQSCRLIFGYWYNDNSKNYKHKKHAFNSLCKHYGEMVFKRKEVLMNGKTNSVFWTFKGGDTTWMYQIEEEPILICKKSIKGVEILNKDLGIMKRLIELLF